MSVKELVRRQFAASAANYASPEAVQATGPNLDALVEVAALTGQERVLDVGCGPGYTAFAVAPGAREVVALDLTPEMLDAARELARERGIENVCFEQGDVETLPFPDASFDCVTCRFSAHHYVDVRRAVAEMARVLRPGGQLVLVDSIAPEDDTQDAFLDAIERMRDPSHVRNWRVSEWAEMLRAAGFTPKLRGTWDMFLDFRAWVERMNTPPEAIAGLEALFAGASEPVRRRFHVAANCDWHIPVGLISGRLAES
jgi:ubiquinone/menaquinone biosynthesis C-methylase UbiE